MRGKLVAVVTAHNEEDRLPDTLAALADAFPGARVVVADDASTDGTAHAALQAGAELSRAPRNVGKGANATLAVRRGLATEPEPPVLL
ncbi:MAG: glycosyltransferase, partial [Thermoleophilaceae bacterium]|nr:glycosyltransferase [Thermoleophilaceae bacterium]